MGFSQLAKCKGSVAEGLRAVGEMVVEGRMVEPELEKQKGERRGLIGGAKAQGWTGSALGAGGT